MLVSCLLLAALAAAIVNHAGIKLPPAAVGFLLMDRLWLAAEPAAIGAMVATIGAATTLFAAWPARQASRVPPITAIHHVG
jgi:ABC-type lipoprotein release transport system permease subunit